MPPRYFTLEEAESLLPNLAILMGEARDLRARIDAKGASWQKNPTLTPVERALAQGQVDFLISQINDRMEEIVRLGARPTDLELGLVDFPARIEGREVNLCWRLGEKRINFWHGLEEGFSGRKPLPVSGRAPR